MPCGRWAEPSYWHSLRPSSRLVAVFLTRVPFPRIGGELPPVGHAVPWFPVVGLAIGAATGGVYVGALELMTRAPQRRSP